LAPWRYGERPLVAGDADNPVQVLHNKIDLAALTSDQLNALEKLADSLISKKG
jgi:hypothetical protein